MASLLQLPQLSNFSSLFINTKTQSLKPQIQQTLTRRFTPHYKLNPPKASINDENTNGAATESPKRSRRGRKKKQTSSSSSSTTTTKAKKAKRSKHTEVNNGSIEANATKEETSVQDGRREGQEELWDYDDGMDFPYEYPPLICCFGAVQKEFVPTVRVHDNQMHPDIYSQWKMLQWDPPEFGRAPGGPPSNVAISHVRLGGRAAFMGKVGDDDLGNELVLMMNKEKVQTRGVKFDENVKTSCTYMKIKFEDGKMKTETVKESAEDSLLSSELNLAVLKEVIQVP